MEPIDALDWTWGIFGFSIEVTLSYISFALTLDKRNLKKDTGQNFERQYFDILSN